MARLTLIQFQAKSDAEEFARAKVSYGKGSGTRRKLIREQVESRSKNPEYKKWFDLYLSKQDMSKHVSAAKKERAMKDAAEGIGGIAKQVLRSTGLSINGIRFF